MYQLLELLELLFPYSSNWYYVKGKDFINSDVLSQTVVDDSNPMKL